MSETIQNVDTGTPVQPQEPTVPATPIQGGDVVNTPTPITEFDIDGLGKVKLDDIKEWKQGYMRQSDYTKKTQTIAQQKKEIQDAIELYNYFKANPQIAQQVADGQAINPANTPLAKLTPEITKLSELERKFSALELDVVIKDLKTKYTDFDEVAVLEKADELGTEDLEFVYRGLKGSKVDTLAQDLRKQIEAELLQKIQANNIATKTIVTPADQPAVENHGLTPDELAICAKAGWNPETYAKNKMR